MNYLAIDTCGKNLTVIIKKGDKIFKHFDDECGVSHSVDLMPMIEKLAMQAEFDFNTADFFACVVGAGSFTGIRIGISTVKAMCFVYKKPCLAITSFDTIAYNIKGGKTLALIDAKHDGFYACGYDDGKVVIEPCYIMKDQVKRLLKDFKGVSSTDIKGLKVKKVSVLNGLINAIESKKQFISDNPEDLVALYVRKSQAEEGR